MNGPQPIAHTDDHQRNIASGYPRKVARVLPEPYQRSNNIEDTDLNAHGS
ncbi:hypothetical protein CAG63_09760 [Vibrio sp. V37_P2S8PM304]|nr:hypothetical protein [Vibrio sp. V37_P2S8PM304]